MKKSTTKLFSLLLAMCMMLGIAGSAIAEGKETPLVFGTGHFNQKFSPFYSDSVYDSDVSGMIQLGLMVLDRMGETIYNGIEGETKNFNGNDYTYYGPADLKVEYDQEKDITTYTTKLRDDLKFSDGEPVTADDLIFTYYVYLDPGYVGSTTMNSYPIIGLDSYVTQVPQELYDNFTKVFDGIYEAKADHEWAEGDEWTKEQQESVWAAMEAEWKKDLQGIVDYVVTNYAEMAEDIGKTAEEVVADADLQAALTMFAWNFGKYEDGKLTGGEKTWDLAAGEKPTFDEFYEVVYNLYEGDAVKYWDTEKVDNDDVHGTVKAAFVKEEASKDEAASAGVPNIAGIEKVDDYTVTVKTKGYEAPAIYSILGIAVAPKHYYGDPEQYDYDNNQFGHPFGDLSVVESKTSDPMGAGPYKFVEY
ncbi:MAG: hypothetical protein GX786_11240, partial [Clostridiales bacterium]|nr:hypothetical protein [Clostridiales bacterium]